HSGCRNRNGIPPSLPLPTLPVRTNIQFECPGIGRLVMQRPIGFGHGCRVHELSRLRLSGRALARHPADTLAHPGCIDGRIDNKMGDMYVLRSQLARHALRNRAQAEFGAGEGSITDTATQTCRSASEKDGAASMRQHQARSLAADEKARIAAHFPDLAENAPGRVQQREIDIGADVENAGLKRRVRIGIAEKPRYLILVARIEAAPHADAALRLDFRHKGLKLVRIPAACKNRITLAGKFSRDGRADKIARPHDRDGRLAPVRHGCPSLYKSCFGTNYLLNPGSGKPHVQTPAPSYTGEAPGPGMPSFPARA